MSHLGIINVSRLFEAVASLVIAESAVAQVKDVAVAQPTRIDWAFAARGFGKDAAKLPAGYASTAQKYQLVVPKGYSAAKAWPLIVFISAGNQPAGWNNWKKACEMEGVLFCSPHEAGNSTPAGARTRIVLDMLDDVRRKYRIDPQQTYLSGFSGGGRMACSIGYALPELFAGVVPVCGTNPIAPPTYVRHRLEDRVSVAFVTGEKDFNRKENEANMAPYFEEIGIRSKLWVVPGMAHAIPSGDVMETVYAWLKEDLPRRIADAKARPELAVEPSDAPNADEQAKRFLAAADKELANKDRIWRGVALLQGVVFRWDKSPSAKAASAKLKALLADERMLDAIGIQGAADEQRFLSAQAKGLERFGDLARAVEAWELLARNYEGTPAGQNATDQVRRLRAAKK